MHGEIGLGDPDDVRIAVCAGAGAAFLPRCRRAMRGRLLARLEEHAGLARDVAMDDQPESVAAAAVESNEMPPPPNSSFAHPKWPDSDRTISIRPSMPTTHDRAGTESSAWIPAVRPVIPREDD